MRRYAFGLGLGQVVVTTLFFSALLLPVGDAVGTKVRAGDPLTHSLTHSLTRSLAHSLTRSLAPPWVRTHPQVLEVIQPAAASGVLEIRSALEAVVIGFALSLSSSAFTLQVRTRSLSLNLSHSLCLTHSLTHSLTRSLFRCSRTSR